MFLIFLFFQERQSPIKVTLEKHMFIRKRWESNKLEQSFIFVLQSMPGKDRWAELACNAKLWFGDLNCTTTVHEDLDHASGFWLILLAGLWTEQKRLELLPSCFYHQNAIHMPSFLRCGYSCSSSGWDVACQNKQVFCLFVHFNGAEMDWPSELMSKDMALRFTRRASTLTALSKACWGKWGLSLCKNA